MNKLTNVMRLEFYSMKSQFKLLIAALFVLLPLFLVIGNSPQIIMLVLTFTVFLIDTTYQLIKQYNFDKLYASLPLKKKDIIFGKYIYALSLLLIVALITLIVSLITASIFKGNLNSKEIIFLVFIGIFIDLFILSLQLPLYFKFNFAKSQIITVAPFFIIFAIATPVLTYIQENTKLFSKIPELMNYINNNPIQSGLIMMVIGLTIFALSYFVSKKVYKS
ncbi:ABC-2 transporter permease [Floricoccus penangensis]|uniref:ABC-2 transporter permease n=1 Tax=Floricoccus penangensis TaxID=1859475 RepID=UPI00203FC9A5|nr:ABC-2 transporter permease [Floricoccus penangensis]URZ87900.1 ABC-2 transporter permease [Floricoccus penangensis]